jgi:hypothetical protein
MVSSKRTSAHCSRAAVLAAMCASVAWSFGYRRVGVQTAVLAMGIGEGGRAGIAIDDSLSTTRTPVKAGTCRTASATTDVRGGFPNLIVIPFSCEAAGSEK